MEQLIPPGMLVRLYSGLWICIPQRNGRGYTRREWFRWWWYFQWEWRPWPLLVWAKCRRNDFLYRYFCRAVWIPFFHCQKCQWCVRLAAIYPRAPSYCRWTHEACVYWRLSIVLLYPMNPLTILTVPYSLWSRWTSEQNSATTKPGSSPSKTKVWTEWT